MEEKDISADLHSPLIYPLPEEIQKVSTTLKVPDYFG